MHICRSSVLEETMSDVTQRDRVWAAALEVAADPPSWRGFRTRHVRAAIDDPPSQDTIQRTLRAMTELGVLRHRKNSPRWRAGDMLDLDVPSTDDRPKWERELDEADERMEAARERARDTLD